MLRGGRTNRVWRFRDGDADLVLKLYRNPDPNPLFANDPGREIRTLSLLRDTALAPDIVASGQCPDGTWLLYQHVPGKTWQADTAAAAHVLSRIHALPTLPHLARGPNGSQELERQTFLILDGCDADRAAVLRHLRPDGEVAPVSRLRLVHGDPVPANIIAGPSGLSLIDWQCPVLGDPADDIAVFLSPAMQILYRGAALSQAEVDTFLAAYPDTGTVKRYLALRPWYHWRMAAYCLWQDARGRADYGLAMRAELDALRDQSSAK